MAPSRTKKWSAELKAGFRQRILNKEINPGCTDKAYIETIRKWFYPDCPYETFCKNWNSSVAEYRVGKAQDLYNKGKSYDAMTVINSVFVLGHSPSFKLTRQLSRRSPIAIEAHRTAISTRMNLTVFLLICQIL